MTMRDVTSPQTGQHEKRGDGGNDLRGRLIEAATKILRHEGYESMSMRRVAQEAQCSQMAMYRHFANKEALTQYLCLTLYGQFTDDLARKMAEVANPKERLLGFVEGFIQFAQANPDYYSLIFLVRQSDPKTIETREQMGRQFIAHLQDTVQLALPPETELRAVTQCLRQILFSLHGAATLLIVNPNVYGLTAERVIDDVRPAVSKLLESAQ